MKVLSSRTQIGRYPRKLNVQLRCSPVLVIIYLDIGS